MHIKPRAGLTVRDPRTMEPLPESGRTVTANPYWRRRLKSGDVVEAAPPPKTRTKPAPTEKQEA